jgi:Spy/CpxP family protein refolding chaperone
MFHTRMYGWGCGSVLGGRPHGWSGRRAERFEASDFGGAGGFGVRRPLRFLAHKLDLDESQLAELAAILDELKTERAQADVDARRTLSAFAEAVGGDRFDEARAAEGAALRVRSAERLREAILKALRSIHALLDAEQRTRLAYLIRTGIVAL